MRHFPYPLTFRILNGYIEIQAPDFGIIRAKKRFDEVKKAEEIGNLLLDVMKEVIEILDSNQKSETPNPAPSKPRGAFEIQDENLLTTKEVESLLQISHESVRRLSNSGALPSFRTEGGHRRFKESDISAYLLKMRS